MTSVFFAPMIYDMLDWIELVFSRLKQFNLKMKPKKVSSLILELLFLGHVLSAEGISANPEKVEKVKKLACTQKHQRGPIHFGLSLILQAVY